jgi:hypothetical protein
MKIDIKRTLPVTLRLTEDEALLLSAGLYALEFWFESTHNDDDFRVKDFSDERESVRNSLQAKFGEAGLWIAPVRRSLEGVEIESCADPEPTEEEKLERERACEEHHRKRLEGRGLPGITEQGERVLQQLVTWAWRHPDQWVPTTCNRRAKYMGYEGLELDENWLPQIEFLVRLGRITPKIIDGQEGWLVPSALEWRAQYQRMTRQKPKLELVSEPA